MEQQLADLDKLQREGIIGKALFTKVLNECQRCNEMRNKLISISQKLTELQEVSDPVVYLNVGGKTVDFSKLVLHSEESFFGSFISAKWASLFSRDSEGRKYLELDHDWVKPLLNFLRTKSWQHDLQRIDALVLASRSYFNAKPIGLNLNVEWIELADRQYLTTLFPTCVGATSIFKATVDGFAAAQFHAKCDGVSNLLIICKSANGGVFGAFTGGVSFPRDGNARYITYATGLQPFLFTLRWGGVARYGKDERYGNGHVLYHNPGYGPTFGGGHDLHICDNCNANAGSYINRGNGYLNTTGLGHQGNFLISEYEVYELSLLDSEEFQFERLDLGQQKAPNLKLSELLPYVALPDTLLTMHHAFKAVEQFDRDISASYTAMLEEFTPLVLEIDFVARHFGISTGREVTGASRPVDILQNTLDLYELLVAAGEQRKDSLAGAELMTINCSGTVLTIKKQTVLEQVPENSLLYSMASDKFAHQLDKKGNVFLNEDAEVVEPILNYLRGKELLRRNKKAHTLRLLIMEGNRQALDRVLATLGLADIPVATVVWTATVK